MLYTTLHLRTRAVRRTRTDPVPIAALGGWALAADARASASPRIKALHEHGTARHGGSAPPKSWPRVSSLRAWRHVSPTDVDGDDGMGGASRPLAARGAGPGRDGKRSLAIGGVGFGSVPPVFHGSASASGGRDGVDFGKPVGRAQMARSSHSC